MLVSFRLLTKQIADQLQLTVARSGGSFCVGASHKMYDSSYEDAAKALLNLQSNAETIAKARQNIHNKVIHNIPNMIRYIHRSGLTMDDVDKLSVIHVSGTKGKGSTCAFCERILHSHGYKTGLFTSPHMIEVRERIRINGQPISRELFSKYFWKVYNNLQMTQTEAGVGAEDGGGMPPYFAFLTVLSLHVFLSEGVNVAVVEVGIGGQYDSTNFFRKPVVCGVTSLGLDHTAILGHTITEIAWNKAGIFKPGRPAVTVHHEQSALEVLRMRANEIQNPLYIAKEMSSEFIKKYKIKLGIAGSKQAENASLAIQLYRMWEHLHGTGKDVTEHIPGASSTIEEIPQLKLSDLDEATLKGLSSCVWPGRAQTIKRGAVTYYLDGAHTKESMEVCAQWFEEASKQEKLQHSGKKFTRILLFNTTSDREVGPLLSCLVNCKFDAALFCTNVLSVVESCNRVDQINKTVTPKLMTEKVDINKSTWDELIAKNKWNTVMRNDVSLNHDKHHMTAHDCVTSHDHGHILKDHNINISITKGMTQTVDKNQETDKNDIKQYKGIVADCMSAAGRVIKISTHNNFDADHRNVLDETENFSGILQDRKLNKSMPSGVPHHSSISIGCDDPSISLTFPCILHALAWATQGKEPFVKLSSREFVAPSVPSELCNVDHIQILVTGSLHLVGGVLGVVDPDMND